MMLGVRLMSCAPFFRMIPLPSNTLNPPISRSERFGWVAAVMPYLPSPSGEGDKTVRVNGRGGRSGRRGPSCRTHDQLSLSSFLLVLRPAEVEPRQLAKLLAGHGSLALGDLLALHVPEDRVGDGPEPGDRLSDALMQGIDPLLGRALGVAGNLPEYLLGVIAQPERGSVPLHPCGVRAVVANHPGRAGYVAGRHGVRTHLLLRHERAISLLARRTDAPHPIAGEGRGAHHVPARSR